MAEQDVTSVTVGGVELPVPLEVRAATSIVAMFHVDAAQSQAIIGESGFTIQPTDEGAASLYVVAVAYLDTAFGRYNEVGIGFEVESLGPEASPNFLQWLPVTGEFSCRVGRELWGFPKWVTDLRYTSFGEGSQMEWFEDGDLVLRLEVGEGGADLGDAEMPVSSYTVGPNGPQCTQTEMRNKGITIGGPGSLEIGPSTHEAAEALRTLGVDGAEPTLTTRINHSSSSWGLAQGRTFEE